MDALSGLADLQDVIRPAGRCIAAEFGARERYLLMPSGLVLDSRPDGRPDLSIEFVTDRTTDDPADCLYAMIEMGLALSDDAIAAHRDLQAEAPGASLQMAALMSDAWWVLELPFAEGFAQPMSWSAPGSTRLMQRLPEQVGLALYRGLEAGGASLRCAVQADIACVAPRLPLTVTAPAKALLTALRGLAPGRESLPYDRMVAAFLDGGAARAVLRLAGTLSPADTVRLASAMALQLRMRLGRAVPTPSIQEGPHVALPDPGDPSLPAEMSFDLAAPLLARQPVLLTGDPFAMAARAAGKDIGAFTSFSRVRSFDAMTRLRVSLAASLPPALQNVLAVEATLRVAPELTPHGSAFVRTVSLLPAPAEGSDVVELAFRDPARKIYSRQVSIITEAGDRVSGDETDETEEFLLVDASLLPAAVVTVLAGATLRARAALSVRLIDEGGKTLALARIDDAVPAVSFALVRADAAAIEIEAHDPTGKARSRTLRLPLRSVALDTFSFPGYGANAVSVTVAFHGKTGEARFAFEPEAPGAQPVVLAFTPAAPTAAFRYSVTDIFRHHYRWRPAAGGPWSDYCDPAIPLLIEG